MHVCTQTNFQKWLCVAVRRWEMTSSLYVKVFCQLLSQNKLCLGEVVLTAELYPISHECCSSNREKCSVFWSMETVRKQFCIVKDSGVQVTVPSALGRILHFSGSCYTLEHLEHRLPSLSVFLHPRCGMPLCGWWDKISIQVTSEIWLYLTCCIDSHVGEDIHRNLTKSP